MREQVVVVERRRLHRASWLSASLARREIAEVSVIEISSDCKH
jgi:hypothetical protein